MRGMHELLQLELDLKSNNLLRSTSNIPYEDAEEIIYVPSCRNGVLDRPHSPCQHIKFSHAYFQVRNYQPSRLL